HAAGRTFGADQILRLAPQAALRGLVREAARAPFAQIEVRRARLPRLRARAADSFDAGQIVGARRGRVAGLAFDRQRAAGALSVPAETRLPALADRIAGWRDVEPAVAGPAGTWLPAVAPPRGAEIAEAARRAFFQQALGHPLELEPGERRVAGGREL